MPSVFVLAQAKINLFLRVLAREASGQHQLETLFCRLALGDGVTVRTTGGSRSLQCRGAYLPPGGLGPPEENLAWQAAAAYARQCGWPGGFAIEIEKRIPVGGGLGGGSADAAAVLRGLNALNPAPLPEPALLSLAASLGADVPFLAQAASPLALGWGRGERLLTLPPLPPRVCWLFLPGIPIATRDAYSWLDHRPAAPAGAAMTPDGLARWDEIARLAHNDFEVVVGERFPLIAAALAGLRSPAARDLVGDRPIIQMSGSGSTLYAICADPGARSQLWRWRSDEPGFSVIQTTTAERVEPVIPID
jgi:4-diphosphocytidyl-2-C-methyl-D-erythritol kinase